MSRETEKCVFFLKEKYALDISMYDSSFLENGIRNRMAVTTCKTVDDYLAYLVIFPAESAELLDQLSNSYSYFFRNPLTFIYLEQFILPDLVALKLKNNEKEIRIWSAACASGQEAYSLAILCHELMENTKTHISFRIFATDIDQEELVNAPKGTYQSASLGNVTLKRIQTYFTKQCDTYTIASQLKEYIDFSIFDLFSENGTCPPASIYGNFDLVFCSNLLFYYQPEYRNKILNKVGHCIAPDGYLITGETEREIIRENNYREVFNHSAIFQKR